MIATPLDTDMSHWGDGVRHYALDDGTFVAVSVDAGITDDVRPYLEETLAALGVPSLASGAHTIVARPTVIIECRPDGLTDSLDPVHVSTPGASHEEALLEFGYTVTQ